MASKLLPIEQVLTILAETPRRISAVTAGLPPARLHSSPKPDEWSANEVLAHLRACADVWGGCITRIITEDTPTLRAINPLAWITRTDYPDLEFELSVRAYSAQRAELLAVLQPLPPEGWSRTATVTGAGAPLVRTVHTYAQWLARHERPHVKQIERVVNTMQA